MATLRDKAAFRAVSFAVAALIAAGCSAGSTSASRAGSPAAPTATPQTVITLPTQLPATLTHEQAMRLFEYDRSRPFDVQERSTEERGTATVHDITYIGAAGQRRQAYLVIPHGQGPFGGTLYLHGAGGGSRDFLDEAVDLAGHGVASLLVSQPEGQPLPGDPAPPVTEIIFEMRELSRDLDLLASSPEVDPRRLGFVGFSFGAVRGATFAGSQGSRLRIAVLASTPPSYDTPGMASFDPIAWVPYVSPAALYIQEGRQDTWFTADQAESLIAAAREPKKLAWYDANHGLNAEAYDDRLGWLSQSLGTK